MKKILLIILFILFTGCGLLDDGCHQCKGLSPAYSSRLTQQYENELISYTEMMSKVNQALNCKVEVCDENDYCKTHR